MLEIPGFTLRPLFILFCQALARLHIGISAVLVLSLLHFLVYPPSVLGSDILRKDGSIEDLRFKSYTFDGMHFIFTRYDSTGNRYELVFYNLRERKVVSTIPDLSTTTRFLTADDRHAFVIDSKFPKQMIVIDKNVPTHRKIIELGNKGAKKAFAIDQRLYIFQDANYKNDLCLIYDPLALNLLATKEIEKSKSYHSLDGQIVGLGDQIILYDQDFNLIRRFKNELKCQLGMAGTINGALYFSDICGKIYRYDPKTNTRIILSDLGELDLPSGLHKFSSLNFDINNNGLMIAVHSNKESYPKLFDIKLGRLLKTLMMSNIPNRIMIDEDVLYFIFEDWIGRKSRIEVYTIDKSLLSSDSFYAANLEKAHDKALQLFAETKDFYRAIEVLENADIVLMVKGERRINAAVKAKILNDYAYFLSLTYDRYKDTIPLLDQVIALSTDPTGTYVNMADVYYKLYTFEKRNAEFIEKANFYYDLYKKSMKKSDDSKMLKRSFVPIGEETLVKSLAIAARGLDIARSGPLFWENRIFVGTYNCYSTGDDGPKILIYDRDTYSLIKELKTIECSDEQQDSIGSLRVQGGKLFVSTGYRYEDKERPNLFIYDLSTFGLLERYHEEFREGRGDFFGINISHAEINNAQYLDDYIRSGRKFWGIKGKYETNNKRYLITSGKEEDKEFHIYDLLTQEKNENIDLARPRAIYYLFEDIDKVAIRYFASSKTIMEIYDIKNKERRNILSLDNNPGRLGVRTPIAQTYKQYLIVAHRGDLIFYDARSMEIVKFLKNIIPENSTEEGRNSARIEKLVSDQEKKKLLIFTLLGRHNKLVELNFLGSSIREK